MLRLVTNTLGALGRSQIARMALIVRNITHVEMCLRHVNQFGRRVGDLPCTDAPADAHARRPRGPHLSHVAHCAYTYIISGYRFIRLLKEEHSRHGIWPVTVQDGANI